MRAAFAFAALGITAACDDQVPIGPEISNGRVRVVHALSNVSAVDILLGSSVYENNVAYKSDDGYHEVDAGLLTVRVRKAGVSTDLTTAPASVDPRGDRTVIVMGTEAAPLTLVLNDNNATPAAGKIRVRFVHAAVGAGPVDAYIVADAAELPTATPAATNLAAQNGSLYVDRDAGAYIIVFTATGSKTPLLTIPGVVIASGKVRTFVATEKAGGGTPLESIILADN